MLSSHLVADLERVCDYLIVLVASRVQLAGDVDELLADAPPAHRPAPRPGTLPADQQVVIGRATPTGRARCSSAPTRPILDPAWTVEPLGLEDLVLAYMRQAGERPAAPPSRHWRVQR